MRLLKKLRSSNLGKKSFIFFAAVLLLSSQLSFAISTSSPSYPSSPFTQELNHLQVTENQVGNPLSRLPGTIHEAILYYTHPSDLAEVSVCGKDDPFSQISRKKSVIDQVRLNYLKSLIENVTNGRKLLVRKNEDKSVSFSFENEATHPLTFTEKVDVRNLIFDHKKLEIFKSLASDIQNHLIEKIDDPQDPRWVPEFANTDFRSSDGSIRMYQIGNLIWSSVADHHMTQWDAEAYCRNLDGGGAHLPSREEWEQFARALGYLIHYNPEQLPDTENRWFWSSSACLDSPDFAYMFSGTCGYLGYDIRTYSHSVRCVR